MMVPGLIEFTFGEVVEIVGYVVLVCVVAALPASVALAVVGWRRHGRSRPRRYVPTDRPNPWVRQGDPRSGLSWGETTTGQQGER